MSLTRTVVETVTRMPEELRSRNRTPPQWWSDAKLGIFIHWGIYSVPGYAPVGRSIDETISEGEGAGEAETPYAEWYANSLRFPDSSVSRHHRETYGDQPYEDFVEPFERGLESWDPEAWAHAFAATGAGYVVMVTKHHDGYCMWPTDVPNPHAPGFHSKRDLVGELATAVRAEGMRFGTYYSGGYDWTFNSHPIGSGSDGLLAVPHDGYHEYAARHVAELAERYEPSVMWNDICWPSRPKALYRVLRDYFATVPDGVVNDRFMPVPDLSRLVRIPRVASAIDRGFEQAMSKGGIIPPKPPFAQFRTPEYADLPDGLDGAWEMTRGLDHSFAYNRLSTDDDLLSRDELLDSLTDAISKGGNFLLNVGPKGVDASIPDEQLRRLEWMAERNAETPWTSLG
ncbi:alpha-L-fucosidase [Actinospongicola halichondriae]|uniref:alpha-L-fucosidase n=1 Tax=Actinospongicola halichondriae TaxID=3236844 RepID=UPI003D56908F